MQEIRPVCDHVGRGISIGQAVALIGGAAPQQDKAPVRTAHAGGADGVLRVGSEGWRVVGREHALPLHLRVVANKKRAIRHGHPSPSADARGPVSNPLRDASACIVGLQKERLGHDWPNSA